MYNEPDLITRSMQALKERHGFDTVHARRELVRIAGSLPGTKVLDVGTGSGWLAFVPAKKGLDVVSVDVDRMAIRRAYGRLRYFDLEFPARLDSYMPTP